MLSSNLINITKDIQQIVQYLKFLDDKKSLFLEIPLQIKIQDDNSKLNTREDILAKKFNSNINAFFNARKKENFLTKLNNGIQIFDFILKTSSNALKEFNLENTIDILNQEYINLQAHNDVIIKHLNNIKTQRKAIENTNSRRYSSLLRREKSAQEMVEKFYSDIDYNWFLEQIKLNKTLKNEKEYIKLFEEFLSLKKIYKEKLNEISSKIDIKIKAIFKNFILLTETYSFGKDTKSLNSFVEKVQQNLANSFYDYKCIDLHHNKLPQKKELVDVIEKIKIEIDVIKEDSKYINQNKTLQDLSNFKFMEKFYKNYELKIKQLSTFIDEEIPILKKELKALESKLQTLIEQKTEYLNNIEEFNREYNLHLGNLIRTILNLKKEILYKKTIKQQKEKENYNENKQIFEETKETIDELKNSINELEETLESIDESNESYDEIKSVYEELQSELRNLENELELQEEELEKTREFIEDEDIEEEYEEVKSQYDEYDREYNHIKEEQNTKIDVSEDEKKELKKLYKKAARLCHPDIVPDELKEKANEMMQQLNDAYSKQDLNQVKKVLNSLENGIEFELSSETIEDKELLKEKIREYKENIKNIKSEIDDIKEDETYTTIAELDDWNEYFKEVKNELKKEIKRLEDEAKEVLQKSNENEVPEWMLRLWDWADKNKISKNSISRDQEQLIKLKSLELINMPLDYLPIELSNLTKLVILKLWDCSLEYLPLEIVKLTNLKILNLRGNKLSLTNNQKAWLLELEKNNCTVYKESISFVSEDVVRNRYNAIYNNANEKIEQNEIVTKKAQKVSKEKKTKKTIIQKEYKTPYAKHILSIQNPNFERIRRYCNNLVNENKAGKMQEFLAQNGKMYKALLYDALEQFLAQLEGEDITLVDWGCDQGIASMLVRDYIKEKQLNIKVSQVILIDSNKAKLSRAMTQIEAVAQDEIKIIALKSDDNKLFDTIKTYKNNTTLNLFANDKMPIDCLDINYDIFEKDYFICVSNKNKEFVDEVYGNFNSFINVQDVSIRDGKIGRYHKYERIFRTIENYIPEVDEYGIPF